MKIQFCSDLHMEVWKHAFPEITYDDEADVIIFAGDISNNETQAVSYMAELVKKGHTVMYVPGNHEYYRHDYKEQYEALKKACEDAGVIFLEMEYVDIDGVRFIGATLWTDYRANPQDTTITKMIAKRNMMDHYVITIDGEKFTPDDCERLNDMAKEFLRHNIDPEQKTIVVTHHAPTLHAVAPRFKGDALNPAFVNDWSEFVYDLNAEAWIFGHTHHDIDVTIGNTRVVSSQLGYPGERYYQGLADAFKPKIIEL